jgi:hypothetical protein
MSRIRKPPPELVNVTDCRVRDYLACGTYDPRDDPRLQQDMEAELAADVEFFDHPTLGRIRLRDTLVHPPGPIHLDDLAAPVPDEPSGRVFGDDIDLDEALDALADCDDFAERQPFYDRRTDRLI